MNKRIAIVTCIDFPNGLGNTMRIKLMGKAFINIGHSVSLVMPYAPGTVSKGINNLATGKYDGIEFTYCNGTAEPPKKILQLFYLKTFGLLKVLRELIKIHRRDKIDFIYLYGTHGTIFYEDLAYVLLSKIIKAKIIIDVNDSMKEGKAYCGNSNFGKYLLRIIKSLLIKVKGNFTLKNADYIFFVTNYLYEELSQKKLKAKMLHIPLLVDASLVNAFSPKNKSERHVICYAGFLKEYEGIDFLLEVLNYLKEKNINFVCYIYGATQTNTFLANKYNYMIKEMDLEKFVFIRESVAHDQVQSILQKSDVLVIPRKTSEITLGGFSQKYGDYLLSGIPVVSTKVGEITTLLEDKHDILFTEEGKTKQFADAINYVFQNSEEAKLIGLKGRQFAINNFDYKIVSKKINEFIEMN